MKRRVLSSLAVVALLVIAFAGGMITQRNLTPVIVEEASSSSLSSLPSLPEQKTSEVIGTGESKIIVDYPPNQCMINFTSTELLGPGFFVGYGDIGSAFDLSMYDKKKYNPKGVDVNETMSLIDRVVCLDGITGDVYAENYTLTVEIATSHLDRRDQIVKDVINIINDFNDNDSVS